MHIFLKWFCRQVLNTARQNDLHRDVPYTQNRNSIPQNGDFVVLFCVLSIKAKLLFNQKMHILINRKFQRNFRHQNNVTETSEKLGGNPRKVRECEVRKRVSKPANTFVWSKKRGQKTLDRGSKKKTKLLSSRRIEPKWVIRSIIPSPVATLTRETGSLNERDKERDDDLSGLRPGVPPSTPAPLARRSIQPWLVGVEGGRGAPGWLATVAAWLGVARRLPVSRGRVPGEGARRRQDYVVGGGARGVGGILGHAAPGPGQRRGVVGGWRGLTTMFNCLWHLWSWYVFR